MHITKPDYFDRFRCIASACPDSCCKEWAVQVDEPSAACYRALPGPLGDRLREVLRDEDGQTVMTITEGRCPMWRDDGLCRIQAELGEAALCKTCREFPRLTHDYGDFVELGLELSCPEAAKFILSAPLSEPVTFFREGSTEADYDEEAMAVLKATRKTMLQLLSDESRPMGQRLALALLYGCQAQSELDSGEILPFDADAAWQTVCQLRKPGDLQALTDFFLDLEILTPEWEALLKHPHPGPWDSHTPALARYLTERYWLQAVSDYDLYSRVKFILIVCLLVRHLGGDIFRTAQLLSKEIENDADNVDAILDAAYDHPAFTDDKLLGMLLS
ncbi:MAG: flagellin lysine-N-methylase [Oscillospiraceae bacterium]|nr:flagellin lysine-N-methylase [Oscillospiraceae bacterium]MBQ7129646.1 flagellin lysine-N-methylase [Oscillospiraceae bacterium]